MRRGCISLGEVQCDKCHRVIPNYDRYLVVEEKNGVEDEQGKPANYCVDCATKKGYVSTKDEKGEKILTFFP
jgi:ribosomal protein S26